MTVPSTDDLFRPTAVPDPDGEVVELPHSSVQATAQARTQSRTQPRTQPAVAPAVAPAGSPAEAPRRTPSGRVKHDEKMTVYVTSDELLEIEHARLELRRLHSLAVDRGRIVRAAVAVALADLDEHGDDSMLLQRLRQQA